MCIIEVICLRFSRHFIHTLVLRLPALPDPPTPTVCLNQSRGAGDEKVVSQIKSSGHVAARGG